MTLLPSLAILRCLRLDARLALTTNCLDKLLLLSLTIELELIYVLEQLVFLCRWLQAISFCFIRLFLQACLVLKDSDSQVLFEDSYLCHELVLEGDIFSLHFIDGHTIVGQPFIIVSFFFV